MKMKRHIRIVFLTGIVLLIFSVVGQGATRTATATGNWNSTTTWGGNPVPVAGDIVNIGAFTVTVTANAACASVNFTNTGGTLTINSGMTLTVSTTVTENSVAGTNYANTISGSGTLLCASLQVGSDVTPSADRTTTLTLGVSTLTISGNLVLYSSANSTRENNAVLNISAGIITVIGSVTATKENTTSCISTLSMATGSQNATLILGGGTPFNLGAGTNTITLAGTSTLVSYSYAGDQAIYPVNYSGLTLSGSGIKTLAATTTANGNVTIDSGVTLSTNNNALTLGNNFVNNGTFSPGSSNITITGTATQNIAGFTTTGNVAMTKTAGTATLTGDVNANGLTINGAGGALNLGSALTHTFTGTITLTAGSLNGGSSTLNENAISATAWGGTGSLFTPGTGTVNFGAAGNQTLSASATTFNNVNFINSGTKTLSSGTIANGQLSIGTGITLAAGNNSLTFGGDFINSGTLNAGSSNVTISGTADQNIAGFTTTGAVSITKTAGKATVQGNINAGALTLNGNGSTLDLGNGFSHSFTGTLTRTAGTLMLGTSSINISGTISGTGGTFNADLGTVNYSRTGQQTVVATTYNNLILSGTQAKTFPSGSTVVNGILSMEGSASVSLTGTLSYGINAALQYNSVSDRTSGSEWITPFTSTGGIIIQNTGTVTLNSAKTISATLSINNGSTLLTDNFNINIGGNFICNGTFTAGTGTVTLDGSAAQEISGISPITFYNLTLANTSVAVSVSNNFSIAAAGALTVNNGTVLSPTSTVIVSGAGTLTGSGTVQVTKTSATPDFSSQYTIGNQILTNIIVDYTGAGDQTISAVNYGNLTISTNGTRTVTLANSGTIGISGVFSPTQTNTTYISTGSTVDFNGGGAQNIPAFNYNNLSTSNAGTKQLSGPVTLTASLSIGSGTTFDVTASSYSVSIGGNWINNGGTFNYSNGTVTFNGSGAQAIQGTAASQSFYNIIISKSAGTITLPIGSTTTLTLNNLSVNQGTLQINDATNIKRTINVNGNLTVQSGGNITTGTGNPNTGGYTLPSNLPPVGQYHSIFHELIINGDFTNSGSARFTNLASPAYATFATNGAVTVRFTGMSDNTATLNGTTNFYNLVIDKGSDKTYVLTINSSSTANFALFGPLLTGRAETAPFTADNPEVRKSLFIKNGTLKLTGNITIPTLSEGDNANGNGDYAIGGNAMLWIAGPNVTVFTTATAATDFPQAPTGSTGILTTTSYQAISVYGTFRITEGFFGTRNSAGFIFWDTPNSTAEVIFEGGLVNTSIFREGVAAGKASYRQSGGTVIVRGDETEAGELAAYAVFDISNPNSTFVMSGGDLIFRDKNTGGASGGNGFYVNAGPGNYSVTGGTVSFETNPANTPSIDISSTVNFWNLNIRRLASTSGTSVVNLLNSLTVSNNFSIEANATLSTGTGNFPVTVAGNFTINSGGTYTPGTNTTTFNGSGNYYLWNDGTITNGLYNLISNKTLGTLIFAGTNNNFTILNDLTVQRDTLADGGKNIFVNGNIINNGICQGAGKISLTKTNGTQTISGNGTGKFRNLELNNTNGSAGSVQVSLASDVTITGNLSLINDRIFDISSYQLTLDKLGTVVGTMSNSRFIRTSGIVSNGGMKKVFNDTTAFVYPVGTGTNYTPSTIRIDRIPSTYGSVTVKPVNSQHPLLTDPSAFNYYWKIEETGFAGIQSGSVRVILNYGNLSDNVAYVPGRYNPPDWTYTNNVNLVDETTNLIWYLSLNNFAGEYTAGIPACFGASVTYYSRTNGDWNSPSSWSTVSFGGTAATSIPGATNPVLIGDGATYNHTITVTAGNAVAGSLSIKQGSILDLGSTSGNNFGPVVSGSDGKLRISSVGSTAIFPAGDFGAFLGASGGTVEYYTTGSQNFTLPVTTAAPSSLPITSYYTLQLSPATGRQITMPNSDLTVYGNMVVSGETVTGVTGLNATATRNLTVKNNLEILSGNLIFQNNALQNLNIEKNINISAGAVFNVSPLGTAVNNTLLVGGNLANGGTFDMSIGSGRLTNVTFNGSTNTAISGSGGTTDFYSLTVNKGSSMSSVLDVTSAAFSFSNNTAPITLSNGTLQLSSPLTFTLSSMGLTIPSTACLSANGGTVLIATTADDLADVDLAGKLQVITGSISIGNQANNVNNDIIYAATGTPTIDIQGGTLFVNGQIRRNIASGTGALTYRQSGSSSVTVNGRNFQATRAKLEVLNSGSVFEMSGTSTLTIVRGGGTSFNDLYIVPTSSNVSGGTILFGNTATEIANQNFTLNSSVNLNNITIDGTTNPKTVSLSTNNLTILGNLLINATSAFNSNGLDLTIGGNLSNLNTGAATGIATGGFRPGSLAQTTTFNSSSANQLITGVAGNLTNFANLIITNTFPSGTVTLAGNTALRVNSDLSLTNGTLADGGNVISVVGNITNSSVHSGSGRIDLVGSGIQTISGNGAGKFENLRLNASYNVQMTASQEITGVLTFNTKMLDIGSNLLKISNTSATAISGSSATSYIRLNGLVADPGVQKSYPSSALDFTFPIGINGKYTPARINVTANSAAGTITIVPVNTKHPGTTNALDKQLDYYWNVKKTGFSGITVSHTYTYIAGDVTGTENFYDAGRYFGANWDYGPSTSVSAALHTANFTSVNYIEGDYTAAETSEFGAVMIFYSRNATSGGNWDDVTAWSTESHSGAVASSYPNGQPVIIAAGHTITANGPFRNAYSVSLQGTLDLAGNTGHDFGTVTGTGIIRISPAISGSFVFPAGDYTAFTSSGGGTVELNNSSGTASFPSQAVFNQLLLSGNGTKQMINADITINSDLTNETGSTFMASSSNKIILNGNWINNGTFTHNSGNTECNGTTTISGSSVTTFNNLTVISAKSLTAPLSATLNIAGNWTNNGTFNHNSGTIAFNGSTTIGGSSVTTFNNITINSSRTLTGKLSDNLIIQGNWVNNGSFVHNGGTVTFDGTSAISGTAVTAFGNLVINNSKTLTAPLSGTMNVMLNFTNNGTFNHNEGKVVFNGLTQSIGGSSQTFFNNLDISAGSTTTIATEGETMKGILLCNGTLNANGKLTLLSTSSQTALIDGAGSGDVNGNVTIQRYLSSGYGYKYFSSPFQEATVGQFASFIDLSASFPTFYKYDENRLSSGWVNYTGSSGRLDPMHGYAANFGPNSTPVTVSLTGVVNNRTLQPLTLTNNDMPYTQGFNLVGNPYPSPIDWDASSGWTKTNIDNALYYFNASSPGGDIGANDSLQYQGTYSSYINGVSSDGTANNIIPALQGFFVHVSTIHPVDATLIFNNGIRINNTNPVFKSADLNSKPLLRLNAGFKEGGAPSDPAVIYFDDLTTMSYDSDDDALKLMNLDNRVPSFYVISKDSKKLSINGIPYPAENLTRIPLGLKTNGDGTISFYVQNMENIPASIHVYLEDASNHTIQDLKMYPEYKVNIKSGIYENRFALLFSLSDLTTVPPIAEAEKFTITPSGGGSWIINVNQTENKRQIFQVVNMQGQIFYRKEFFASETIELDAPQNSGVYIVSVISDNKIYSKKIVIQKR